MYIALNGCLLSTWSTRRIIRSLVTLLDWHKSGPLRGYKFEFDGDFGVYYFFVF